MIALWVIVLCGALSIVYAIWATQSVMKADAGTERMQEISAAVREGAQAYLKRQYATIGLVGIVIFLIVGFLLGWLVAVGFAIGAILSGAAGFIGMNISVRANVRTAQAAIGSDTALRIRFPMTDETRVEDGGSCVDSTTHKCTDNWGEQFFLPSNGSWKQFTIRWSDIGFHQEGWGVVFPWNPQHVLGIQIQSVDKGELYDFWIDDLYFVN